MLSSHLSSESSSSSKIVSRLQESKEVGSWANCPDEAHIFAEEILQRIKLKINYDKSNQELLPCYGAVVDHAALYKIQEADKFRELFVGKISYLNALGEVHTTKCIFELRCDDFQKWIEKFKKIPELDSINLTYIIQDNNKIGLSLEKEITLGNENHFRYFLNAIDTIEPFSNMIKDEILISLGLWKTSLYDFTLRKLKSQIDKSFNGNKKYIDKIFEEARDLDDEITRLTHRFDMGIQINLGNYCLMKARNHHDDKFKLHFYSMALRFFGIIIANYYNYKSNLENYDTYDIAHFNLLKSEILKELKNNPLAAKYGYSNEVIFSDMLDYYQEAGRADLIADELNLQIGAPKFKEATIDSLTMYQLVKIIQKDKEKIATLEAENAQLKAEAEQLREPVKSPRGLLL